MKKIAIFGVSGFSREVADVCWALNYGVFVFLDKAVSGVNDLGLTILPESESNNLVEAGYDFAIGIGNNSMRKKVFQKFIGLPFPNLIHPSATFGKDELDKIETKKGNIITSGVRFTNNITIGDFGIYNLNATIGHDCIIEDFVNIAPGANISGNVYVEEGVYIGTNSSIIQGKSLLDKTTIGRYSTVGAGSVVTKNVPQSTVCVGIPAKPIKK